jgi:hypothetical protein
MGGFRLCATSTDRSHGHDRADDYLARDMDTYCNMDDYRDSHNAADGHTRAPHRYTHADRD